MKKISILLIFTFIWGLVSSCSQFAYITEQGYSQMKIQWGGEKIEKVLARKDLHPDHRRKIELIQKAKKFFFDYLQVPPSKIYREVVFLKQDAVSYLVTASHYYEVKPKLFSFPLMGSFPYIGFFDQKSAFKYVKKLEKENYYTYIRPVYAYSTLGHFEDKILSSFFFLDDITLVETIYHELFHTLFFAKDEVDFNENLASFFAQKMLEKTEFLESEKIIAHFKREEDHQAVIKKVVELVQDYSFQLKNQKLQNKTQADQFLKNFVDTELRPKILEECLKTGLKTTHCTYAAKVWNNASFSAFLTYEKDQFYWHEWWNKQIGMTCKVFYQLIHKEYADYKNNKKKNDTFELKLKEKFKIL